MLNLLAKIGAGVVSVAGGVGAGIATQYGTSYAIKQGVDLVKGPQKITYKKHRFGKKRTISVPRTTACSKNLYVGSEIAGGVAGVAVGGLIANSLYTNLSCSIDDHISGRAFQKEVAADIDNMDWTDDADA